MLVMNGGSMDLLVDQELVDPENLVDEGTVHIDDHNCQSFCETGGELHLEK